MSFMSFSLDNLTLPLYHAEDGKYQPLGAWIITDISIYKGVCLDALAMIADVSAGRPPFEDWDSENYTVSFTPTEISIQNNWVGHERGIFTVAEVRDAVENYWRFLVGIPDNPHLIREYRPDLPEWQAAVIQWEERWGHPHPYHGILV
jgi:hypothetical protein